MRTNYDTLKNFSGNPYSNSSHGKSLLRKQREDIRSSMHRRTNPVTIEVVSRSEYQKQHIIKILTEKVMASRPIGGDISFDNFIIQHLLRDQSIGDADIYSDITTSLPGMTLQQFTEDTSLETYVRQTTMVLNQIQWLCINRYTYGMLTYQVVYRTNGNGTLGRILKIENGVFEIDKRVVAEMCEQFQMTATELKPYILNLVPRT